MLRASIDPWRDPESYHQELGRWACSYYGDLRELYDARNRALHGPGSPFSHEAASGYRWRMQDVVLASISWVLRTRATSIEDLDEDIRNLPAATDDGA